MARRPSAVQGGMAREFSAAMRDPAIQVIVAKPGKALRF